MQQFLNNPIVHGIVAVIAMVIGWFLTSGNPVLTLTIGGVLKVVYTYLVQAA
jgi:hypothetical protein